MWDLDTLREINERATRRAKGSDPYLLSAADEIYNWPPVPFPHIGYRCGEIDKDHERLATVFVDNSGFGTEGERALTLDGFKSRVRSLLRDHGSLLCAIEEAGQFQVHVAIWEAGRGS